MMSVPQKKIAAWGGTCEGIEGIDFKNADLNLEPQPLHFRDGKACTSDQEIADGCDWEHTVTVDKILVPEPGQTTRLIVVNSNHLTGSGAWDHVFFFRCRSGRVISEFSSKYLYGVKIEKRSDTELWLVSGEWLKGDPSCCPSREKKEIVRWDSRKGAYGVSTTTSRRR